MAINFKNEAPAVLRTIGIAMDGVIDRGEEGPGAVPGALSSVRTLMDRFTVTILTTGETYQAVSWLIARGIPAAQDNFLTRKNRKGRGTVLVTNRMYDFDYYIDLKAIRFHSWEQAMAEIGMRLAQDAQGGEFESGEQSTLKAIREITGARSVEEAVFIALGAASVCWSEGPEGVFQSERARAIAGSLLDRFGAENMAGASLGGD